MSYSEYPFYTDNKGLFKFFPFQLVETSKNSRMVFAIKFWKISRPQFGASTNLDTTNLI